MKNFIKNAICFLLLISVVVSFASCGVMIYTIRLPEGYTGGSIYYNVNRKQFFSYHEVHWVETYEEAMLAIEHLQAAGNKVKAILSTYENEYVDAKYCFEIEKFRSEKLEKGQMWYDRKGIQSVVTVRYVGFLDEMTIEELEYTYFESYRTFEMYVSNVGFAANEEVEFSYINITTESQKHTGKFEITQNGEVMCGAKCYNITPKYLVETLVPGFSTDFPKSIVYIGE